MTFRRWSETWTCLCIFMKIQSQRRNLSTKLTLGRTLSILVNSGCIPFMVILRIVSNHNLVDNVCMGHTSTLHANITAYKADVSREELFKHYLKRCHSTSLKALHGIFWHTSMHFRLSLRTCNPDSSLRKAANYCSECENLYHLWFMSTDTSVKIKGNTHGSGTELLFQLYL